MDHATPRAGVGRRYATEKQAFATTADQTYTVAEWRALLALRARYQQGHDLFGPREIAHMRFIRWLYRAGRLEA